MYDLLSDLTVVEGASFIAGPSCGLHLNQFGARVIRFDMIGGGPDYRRWPVTKAGDSLYWEGLNKGKLSVALDLSRPEGRELATAIITAAGDNRGLFVTNYPKDGFLSHDRLVRRRADLITLRVMGWPDGRNGVDYTVNAAVGVPHMTGDPDDNGDRPVNNALPAWDLLAGAYGAFALLAAERQRRMTGAGREIRLALSDIAIGSLGHLGQIAEVMTDGDRSRTGNALYGAFGRDFLTADNHRIMIVAITRRQWTGLIAALEITDEIAALETDLGVSFNRDEGLRFANRDRICPIVAAAVARFDLAEIGRRLDAAVVCWEPYQSLQAAVTEDPRLVSNNDLFQTLRQPSGHTYPVPGALARFEGMPRAAALPAARLGQDTEEVLATELGLSQAEIGKLVDQSIVAA
ncbi:CoA transferase [Antarctobacter sp.]|uniref:CoA transferase n=1 Tax=Antarctobacter sp. TaxID=1872577 RepID=UPI003A9367C6